ncbi:integrase arm-type DNA-binding domain-containing protein [Rugamonas sp. A1-17]|nr:integrase arm-type DNA-binding domain-containing protein [Rugamonas sp. A1-17]
MPKVVAPLTDLTIKRARPKDKPYKLADGGGLYLEVMPSGGRYWRMKYRRLDGKEDKLHFGSYPDLSLAMVRDMRTQARKLLASGEDPGEARRKAARAALEANSATFDQITREWHGGKLGSWSESTAKNILHRFEMDIFPAVGHVPIAKVTAQMMLSAVRKIEERGALEVAKRLTADCSRVFTYAEHIEKIDRNPAAMLHKVLRPREQGHFAAIDADRLPEFLVSLYTNVACMGPVTRIATWLMMYLFVRTSELIETPSDEPDFKNEASQAMVDAQAVDEG